MLCGSHIKIWNEKTKHQNTYVTWFIFFVWLVRFQILMCEPKIIWRTDLKLSLLYPRTYTSVKCYLKSPCSLDKLKPSSAVQESFQVNSRRSKDPLQNEDKKILFLDLTTRFCAGAMYTDSEPNLMTVGTSCPVCFANSIKKWG